MKNLTFYLIAAIVVLAMATYILMKSYSSMKQERDRYKNNYNSVVSESANAQTLLAGEFKRYYFKLDSIGKTLGIKPRNIKDVVNVSYRFKDTIIESYKLVKDSITQHTNFLIERPCYSLQGFILNDSIKTLNYYPHDNIDLFLHRDFAKHFWFIKWKPYYKATAYSECRKDTIAVKTFIHLKNK